ncbi:hypothetical protein O988_07070 [Pseudogymnoascus sp. VKM F-3808]|nr:hypothetical protein O988_07070 [Pseudogymnoascus sp. VKM F-3808]
MTKQQRASELWISQCSECLRDDKFGSAILIAGAALLQNRSLIVFANYKFVGRQQWDSSPQDANPLSDNLVVLSSLGGLSNNGRGDDWGVLGTATKKTGLSGTMLYPGVPGGAQDVGTERGGGGGGQAHYAVLYNAAEKVMLWDN